jgi:outer membrane cobalamin receptor
MIDQFSSMNHFNFYSFSRGLLFILFLFALLTATGQAASVSGMVTDSRTGLPLSGASISVSDKKLGAVSDYNGNYRIRGISKGVHSIKVSFIGYETVEKSIHPRDGEEIKIDFSLNSQPYLADQAVITGNRIMVSRNVTPYSVTVVEGEKIEQTGESNILPVISEQVPGIFVTERGVTGFGVADGSAGGITIRGIGGSPNTEVLLLIDGHPQLMGLFGHPLPDEYVASDVEKAEMIRGPASLLYGTNAMGGVINIITHKEKEDGLAVTAKAGYGSYNTQKYTASAGFKKKRFGIFASYDHDQTDGHRPNSAFQLDNGYLKAGCEMSPNWKLMADVSLAKFRSTDPGPVHTEDSTYKTNPHWQDILRGYGSVTVQNNYNRVEGAIKFYFNYGDQKVYDGFHSIDYSSGFLLYEALKLFPGNTITAGFDYNFYGGMAENTIPVPAFNYVDTIIFDQGTYILVQQSLLKKLILTAGLRLQIHQVYGTEWVPQFGVSWQAASNTFLKANVSKGFRSPTIRELFMFMPANPDLKPEKLWNYELSIMQKFLDQRMSLELTGYYENAENLIETTGQFPNVRNENTGSIRNYGVEFLGKFIITGNLDLDANYSYLHTSQPLVAAPRHQVFAEGTYKWRGFYFNLSARYINHLYSRTEPEDIQKYTILNARVTYSFKRFISLYISGQNLLDQDYAINYDYPMPGITIFGGINFKFTTKSK